MLRLLVCTALAASLIACSRSDANEEPRPDRATEIAAALAAGDRPDEHRERDAGRQVAEVIAFSRVAPGERVLDLASGGGYLTRLFSTIVGPAGAVVAQNPPSLVDRIQPALDTVLADRPNVSAMPAAFDALEGAAESYDLVVLSRFYHDVILLGGREAMNAQVFALLKPGGRYFVTDHAAEAGSGERDVDPLHRVDPELVRREVEAAGFVLIDETDALTNPDDDLTTNIFDDAIRGRTSQFAFLFEKPER